MFCAEPWGYEAVDHKCKQTYNGAGMCLELWLAATKAVSFLLSRPGANMISGVEHLPKSGVPELPVLVLERVLRERVEVWQTG